ncbi:MAG: DUF4105 domain-containing protein [Nitrospiraceae bacterium]|nr:DUF4105 domain-containing protein [Nitrospiraceae bacterium]
MRSPVIRFSRTCRLAKLHIGPWRSGQGPSSLCSHTLKRSLLLALLLWFLTPCFGGHALAENAYLRVLIDEASKKRLAESREWHLLLHYRPTLWGGYESEQDDPGFFLSDSGKTDPEAELRSTLAQFFSPELVGRSQQPAQCAFIARYHWLKEQLAFDPAHLPAQVCDRFNRWYEEFEAESITLIFPSAFLNNPASMFGHTLLRVDQKGQTEQTRILAYTINYAAEVPKDAGIAYPVKGIFGGYRGYFSTIPYYLKVQEYRDIENRDIWEYRLRFTEGQIRRLLMHAWELGNGYFDYFFFKENCSYHLLALLDFADPNLHLTEQFRFWTIPADTVRLIASKPGLVSSVAYRPSRSNVIRRKREFLPSSERRLAQEIAEDGRNLASPALGQLAIGRQAFVLDLASDLLRYRIDKKDSPPELKERNREVLTARSQLRIPSEPFTVVPFAKQPEIGHRTSRASMGAGWRNDDTFEEVSVRAGYHDLLDPEPGYTPDAQIEIGSITARHYNRADQTRIERATLANIVSLIPIDSVFRAPSWKVNIGMQTIRNHGCRLCSNGFINTGVGGAVESRWLKREVWFAFAEAEANYSPAYEERHRIGGGGTAGLLADVTERWKVMATGSYLRYALGEQSDEIRWFVGSRITLTRNWALRVEYNHRHHDNDVVFSVQAYF